MKNTVGKVARILVIVILPFYILLEFLGFIASISIPHTDVSSIVSTLNGFVSVVMVIIFSVAIRWLWKNNKKFFFLLAISVLIYSGYNLIYRLVLLPNEEFGWIDINNFLIFGLPVALGATSYFLEGKAENSSVLLNQTTEGPFSPLQYQGLLVRGSAYIIDNFIIAGPLLLVGYLLGFVDNSDTYWAIVALIFIIYKTICEVVWGKTLGKMVYKIEVRQVDGSKCSPIAAVVRNLLLLIDLMFGFLIPLVVVSITKRRQRVGDLIAKTVVIKP